METMNAMTERYLSHKNQLENLNSDSNESIDNLRV